MTTHIRKIFALVLLVSAFSSSAEVKEFKFSTAADGEIGYLFDTSAKLPIPASDDRVTVTDGSLTLNVKNKAAQWTWIYGLTFKTDVQVSSVTVEDESGKELVQLVNDNNPQITESKWTGAEEPRAFTPQEFDKFAAEGAWIHQRRIIVQYADGVESKLHQLVVASQLMRAQLINRAMAEMKKAE